MRFENDILYLYDYENNKVAFKLKNKDIDFLIIDILSGDEVALVVYDDEDTATFDADINHTREMNFNDGRNKVTEKNLDKFLARTSSEDWY